MLICSMMATTGLWSRVQEEADGCFMTMARSHLFPMSPSIFKTLNKAVQITGLFQSAAIKHYARSSNTTVHSCSVLAVVVSVKKASPLSSVTIQRQRLPGVCSPSSQSRCVFSLLLFLWLPFLPFQNSAFNVHYLLLCETRPCCNLPSLCMLCHSPSCWISLISAGSSAQYPAATEAEDAVDLAAAEGRQEAEEAKEERRVNLDSRSGKDKK